MAGIDEFPYMVDTPPRYRCTNLEKFESDGMLDSCHLKVKIRRYVTWHEPLYTRTWESAAKMVHPNMLKVYHAYINKRSDRPFTLICESYSETLAEYIHRKIRECGGPGSYWYRTVKDFTSPQPYVPLELQNIFSDILRFLKDVHAKGKAMNGFQIGHIVMVENTPKFLGVFMETASDDLMHIDYISLRNLINDVYKGIQKPIDIEDLTQLLENWRKAGDIIFNHCSLWSNDRRMNLLRNSWERRGFFSSVDWNKRYLPMLGKITLPYDWRQQVPKTGPLRKVYDYPIHIVPKIGPLREVYDYPIYTRQAYPYKDTFFDLIRYTRAVRVHAGEYSDNGNKMQEYDVEPIISTIFPGIFSKLQKGIYEMGLEERLQDK